MKTLAKIVRVITVPPLMCFALFSVLYVSTENVFSSSLEYALGLTTLVFIPLSAYPAQKQFNIIKGEKRTAERTLAVMFSIVGYTIGFLTALILDFTKTQKVIYLTYLLSGLLVGFFSYILKVKASGHMCGLSGPVAVIIYIFGPLYIVVFLLMAAVIWASLKLRRHSLSELVLGSIIPVAALFLAATIF